MTDLSRLTPVPLRSHWANEATDFTPWLASDENIELLSETIGIDLSVEETEARVGPFRADILCRDDSNDRYVLIENQLERTDHGHLGQLLTYAAGLDAAAIVWLAAEFTDEHREALDWLNHITGDDFHFFGIQIELWRIGDSVAAPRFNVVVRPNNWTKSVRAARSGAAGQGPRSQMYRTLWSELFEQLSESGEFDRLPNPGGMNQYRVPLRDGKCIFGYSHNRRQLNVYVLFRGEDPVATWNRILERRDLIAADLAPWAFETHKNEGDDYGWLQGFLDFDYDDPENRASGLARASKIATCFYHAFAGELETR
jgi:hypothetical protein